MNRKAFMSMTCVALVLMGCSFARRMPPVNLYALDLSPYAIAPTQRRSPETLRLATVRVAAPFDSNTLFYRFDDVRYVSDPYHAFAAGPGEIVSNQVARWLDAAGPFRDVARPGSLRPARYVLEISVSELYGDFRAGRPPAAVLNLGFALIDQSGSRSRTVYERSISRTIDLPAASREELMRGYSRALSDALTQLTHELEAMLAADRSE